MKTRITRILLALAFAAALPIVPGCDKSFSPGKSAVSIKYTDKYGNTVIHTQNAGGSKSRIDNFIDNLGERETTIWIRTGSAGKPGVDVQQIVYSKSAKDAEGAWKEYTFHGQGAVQGGGESLGHPMQDLTKYYTDPKVGFTKQPGQIIAGKECDVYRGAHPKDSTLPHYYMDISDKERSTEKYVREKALESAQANLARIKESASPEERASPEMRMRLAEERMRQYEGIISDEDEIAVWNGLTMRLREIKTFETTGADGKKTKAEEATVKLEAQAVTFDVPDSAFTKTLETPWIQ